MQFNVFLLVAAVFLFFAQNISAEVSDVQDDGPEDAQEAREHMVKYTNFVNTDSLLTI